MAGESNDSGTKIKAVIFDYGEVLCHRPPDEDFHRLANVFGSENIGSENIGFRELWEKDRGEFDRGDITAEAYWTALAKHAGVEIDAAQLSDVCRWDVEMWGSANEQMVDWLRRLRASGIKTGLLSNIHPAMIAYLRENFDWLDQFDFKTLSAEVRMIKPDPAIYEHTLRGLGVAAAEAIFIDDREINVEAAKKLGIRALRFRSVEKLREDLERMGFPILPGD